VSFIATAVIMGTLAVARTAAQDVDAIAMQFFPEPLAAESREDGIDADDVPRRFVDAETNGSWIFAAYSNGYSGAVRVLERTPTGTRLICDRTLRNMFGKAPAIELLDLDADGTPEILASFDDQYSTSTYWIFAWNGQELHLLSETENRPVTGSYSDITNPTFVDTDGDGTLEIIDHKVAYEGDDEGGRTVEALYTVHAIRDGLLTPGYPAIFFEGFTRGKGKPVPVETDVTAKEMGTYRLRMVNGDNAKNASTSGKVWINGAVVLTTSDFKRSERIVTRPISLTPGSNTLAVQLNGEPGSHVWILLERLP
jgi:FG-GAP-like repeat